MWNHFQSMCGLCRVVQFNLPKTRWYCAVTYIVSWEIVDGRKGTGHGQLEKHLQIYLRTKVLPSGFRVGGVHFVSNHKTKLFNGAPLGCRWVGGRVCIGNRIKSYVCKTTFIIIIVGHVFVKFKLSSGPPPTASVGHPRNDMS